MNLMPRTFNLLAASLLALTLAPAALAQSSDTKPASTHEPEPDRSHNVLKTYFLTNATDQHDSNEILIALRNMLPSDARLYLVNNQSAIVIFAAPTEQALAQKLITEIDRPHKAYRLTFTLADSENGKRVGVQHFSIIVAAGQRTTLKQGSKIPVITGTYNPGSQSAQNQFQYLDVGMNFDVSLSDSPGGLLLKAHVEDSSVGTPSEYGNTSGPLAQEPIVHQTSLEGSSILKVGKPLTLGAVDVAGSTRHLDIEVVAEPVS